MLRLAGEAIVARIGDAAAKLRDQVGDDLPEGVPWDDVIANRIIVDHVYHRVDYEALWNTLERDVPVLAACWMNGRAGTRCASLRRTLTYRVGSAVGLTKWTGVDPAVG